MEKRQKKKQPSPPAKLTRAEKYALKKKQDRLLYISFARELRGYDEEYPAVKDVKFTRTGAHVFFADGAVERIEKADIPEEFQDVCFAPPPVKKVASSKHHRPLIVRPKLQPIKEEAEDQVLAPEEGEQIIVIDDEMEHNLLNMNPLGEVLSSIYQRSLPSVEAKVSAEQLATPSAVAIPANVRDPRLTQKKSATATATVTAPTSVSSDEAQPHLSILEKKRLDQQRAFIKEQQEELFKQQALLDEQASQLEDRLAGHSIEMSSTIKAEASKRKRDVAPAAQALPKIPKLRRPPPRVDEVNTDGDEQSKPDEEMVSFGPGMRPSRILSECVKAAVRDALLESERVHARESKKVESELQKLRELTDQLQREHSESRRGSRSRSRGSSAYDYQVSVSDSDLDEQRDEQRDELPPHNQCKHDRVPRARSERDTPLVERDVSKLEYKLERNKDYRYWFALFKMEMVLKKLIDVIDERVPPCQAFTMQEMAERKTVVIQGTQAPLNWSH